MTRRSLVRAAVAATAALPAAGPALAQTVFPEIEPNDTKAAAQPVGPMSAGDAVTGITTGTNLTEPGDASADYFLITAAPGPLGIYRHRLVITATPAGHIGNLRGSPQIPAPPGPWPGPVGEVGAGDALLQATGLTTNPPRHLQWYGFGKGERVVFRITGTSVTDQPYTATLETTPVQAIPIGPLAAGAITVHTMGHTQDDTDLWIYDSNLDPIRGYGNDDESPDGGGGGSTAQSRLTRRFPPGTYYLAISSSNLASHRTSPCDDDVRTTPVHDFPGALTSSATIANADTTFEIIDGTGSKAHFHVTRVAAYDVLWFRLDVAGSGASDCNANGVDDFLETVNDPALDCWSATSPSGQTGGPDGALDACQCTGNFNRDGAVNSTDISFFLSSWLAAVTAGTADADLNCDGATNSTDISALLTVWLAQAQDEVPFDGCP